MKKILLHARGTASQAVDIIDLDTTRCDAACLIIMALTSQAQRVGKKDQITMADYAYD